MATQRQLAGIAVVWFGVAAFLANAAAFAGSAQNKPVPLTVTSVGAPPAMLTTKETAAGLPWLGEGALDLRIVTPGLLVEEPALPLGMTMVMENPFPANMHVKKLNARVEWTKVCEGNPTRQEAGDKLMKTMVALAQAHPAPVPLSVDAVSLPAPVLEDGKLSLNKVLPGLLSAAPALPVAVSMAIANPFPVNLTLPKATATVDWVQMCDHMPTKATLDQKLTAAMGNLMNTHMNPIPATVKRIAAVDALLNADGTLNMAIVGPALMVANPALPLNVTISITNPFPFKLTVPIVHAYVDLTSPCEYVPAAGDPMFNPAFGSKADCETALAADATGIIRAAEVKLEDLTLNGGETLEVIALATTTLAPNWLYFFLQGIMSPAVGSGKGCLKIELQSGVPPTDTPASIDFGGVPVPARAAFECNVCVDAAGGKLGLAGGNDVDCTDLLLGAQVPWAADILLPLPAAFGPFPPSLSTPAGGDIAAGHLPYVGGPMATLAVQTLTGGLTDGSKESCETILAGKERMTIAKLEVNEPSLQPLAGGGSAILNKLAMTDMPRTEFFLFAQSVLSGKACLEVAVDATLEDGGFISYLGAAIPVQAKSLCKICTKFEGMVLSLADAPVVCEDLLIAPEAQMKMASMLPMDIFLPLPPWFGGAAGFPEATKVTPQHPIAGGILPYNGGPIASVGVVALTGGATDGSREQCQADLAALGTNPTIAAVTLEDLSFPAAESTTLAVTAVTELDKTWFFTFGNSLFNDKVCMTIHASAEGVTAAGGATLGIWLPAAAEFKCELCATGGASSLVVQLEGGTSVQCTDMMAGKRITALYAIVVVFTLISWIGLLVFAVRVRKNFSGAGETATKNNVKQPDEEAKVDEVAV